MKKFIRLLTMSLMLCFSASVTASNSHETTQYDVELSLTKEYLDFSWNSKNPKSVGVKCNYKDWEIESKPDWLAIYISDSRDRISVEVDKNDSKEKRAGIIVIKCKNMKVNLIINQKKNPFRFK